MELTPKQQAFVEYYTDPDSDTLGNASKSYAKAGYKANSGNRQAACRMLTKSHIKQAIIRYKARLDENKEVIDVYTVDKYREELQDAIDLAKALNQPSAAISGIIAKGRSCGYDKDYQINTDEQAKPNMTDEQVRDAEAIAKQIGIKLATG